MKRNSSLLNFFSKKKIVESASASELTATNQNKVLASEEPDKCDNDNTCNNQVDDIDCTSTVSTNDPKVRIHW